MASILLNSVMVDPKNTNNICTEGHLKNDNYPRPPSKMTPNHFTNYNFVLYVSIQSTEHTLLTY